MLVYANFMGQHLIINMCSHDRVCVCVCVYLVLCKMFVGGAMLHTCCITYTGIAEEDSAAKLDVVYLSPRVLVSGLFCKLIFLSASHIRVISVAI